MMENIEKIIKLLSATSFSRTKGEGTFKQGLRTEAGQLEVCKHTMRIDLNDAVVTFDDMNYAELVAALARLGSLDCDHFTGVHKFIIGVITKKVFEQKEKMLPETERLKREIESLKGEVRYFKNEVEDRNREIEKMFHVSHIETENGNYLVKIGDEDLFYISTEGVVLRECDPCPIEEDDCGEVIQYLSSEWDLAVEGWGRPVVSGFPVFSVVEPHEAQAFNT